MLTLNKALLLSLLLTLSTSCFAGKKIEAAKEDLNEVKAKIEALKKELDSNQTAHQDASDALKESETAISAANLKLREIAQKQKENQNTLVTLKKQSLTLNERLAEQQKQLSNLLYQQYSQGNQSYTRLILQNKNPNQIARDLKYQSYIANAHAKLINEMEGNLKQVKKLNLQTTSALQEVADLKAKQEAERLALEAQKKEKAKVLGSLSKQIAAQRNEINKLKRDESNLSNLVERLAKIVPKASPRPSKKKQNKHENTKPDDGANDVAENDSAPNKPSETLAKNDETPDSSYSGVDFASLRGKLKLPVRGELINRFGSIRPDSGVSWKGLFIRANEGADVKSVASGRVVFADWMRGFGNLVIVDHGSGYMSLYGNNQAVLKHVGDEVGAGDTIASVGNSGGNESNGLYYELRRQSKPFDPMSWSVVR